MSGPCAASSGRCCSLQPTDHHLDCFKFKVPLRPPVRHYSSLNPFPLSQSFIHCFLLGEFPPATPPCPYVPSTVSSDHSSTLHVVPFSCPPPKSILISSSLNPSLLHFLLAPSLPFIFAQFLSPFLLRRPQSQFCTLYAYPSSQCNLFLSIHSASISFSCLCSDFPTLADLSPLLPLS